MHSRITISASGGLLVGVLCAAVLMPLPVRAVDLGQEGSLSWTCTQTQDSAFHVVCRPRCVLPQRATANPARYEPATLAPAWGASAAFRSARQVATSELPEGSVAIHARCGSDRQAVSAGPGRGATARHVPVGHRSTAEIFSGRPWSVPLYGPPRDRGAVVSLLREVLCGDRACNVRYDADPSHRVAQY